MSKKKLQAMMKTDGLWTIWRFEFDEGGHGVAWHRARGYGPGNSIEESTGHFIKKGYTIVSWKDV